MDTNKRQRKYRAKKARERQALPKIECECGCGTMIPPITAQGKPAHYKQGHNPTVRPNGIPAWNKGKPAPWSVKTHKGKKLPKEEIDRRTATRLKNNGGVYQTAKGWKHTHKTIENMKIANKANAKYGPDNHWYGKKHTEEAREIISKKLSGKNNPAWRGGVATLPYGPEFTKKFKRMIRDRDNHTCQRCGITRKELGRTLEVHHIDHDKFNNDPTNLATVCGSCNVWCSYHRDAPFVKIN